MKKLVTFIFAFAVLAISSFAKPVAYNETDESNWSDLSYRNIPVYKVLESKDAFVVIYQKGSYGVSQTVLPKSWTHGTPDSPRKLQLRATPSAKIKPYLCVVKKGGEFHRAILTVPLSKSDDAWGVVGRGVQIDSDKDTLEEL